MDVTDNPFRFLALPPEIRLRIYRELLLVKRYRLEDLGRPKPSSFNLSLSILRACHQIHDEAIAVFREENCWIRLRYEGPDFASEAYKWSHYLARPETSGADTVRMPSLVMEIMITEAENENEEDDNEEEEEPIDVQDLILDPDDFARFSTVYLRVMPADELVETKLNPSSSGYGHKHIYELTEMFSDATNRSANPNEAFDPALVFIREIRRHDYAAYYENPGFYARTANSYLSEGNIRAGLYSLITHFELLKMYGQRLLRESPTKDTVAIVRSKLVPCVLKCAELAVELGFPELVLHPMVRVGALYRATETANWTFTGLEPLLSRSQIAEMYYFLGTAFMNKDELNRASILLFEALLWNPDHAKTRDAVRELRGEICGSDFEMDAVLAKVNIGLLDTCAADMVPNMDADKRYRLRWMLGNTGHESRWLYQYKDNFAQFSETGLGSRPPGSRHPDGFITWLI